MELVENCSSLWDAANVFDVLTSENLPIHLCNQSYQSWLFMRHIHCKNCCQRPPKLFATEKPQEHTRTTVGSVQLSRLSCFNMSPSVSVFCQLSQHVQGQPMNNGVSSLAATFCLLDIVHEFRILHLHNWISMVFQCMFGPKM